MHASRASVGRSPISNRMNTSLPPPSNQNVIETSRLASLRRSTPDSEVMASSDDEHDLTRSIQSLTGRSVRPSAMGTEGSWLNEIQSGPPRRPSAATTTSNISQPPTPSEQLQDPTAWPFQNTLGRVSSHPITTSWASSGPWSAHPRAPSEDRNKHTSATQAHPAYSIPIQPVAKTHRSQSYSVGQLESELNAPTASGPAEGSRRTISQHMAHRPVRPSTLSEVFESHPGNVQQAHDPDPDPFSARSLAGPLSPDLRRDVSDPSHGILPLRHASKGRARHGQSASADTRSPTAFSSMYHNTTAYPAGEQVIDEEPEQYNTASLTRRFSELTGLGASADGSRRGQWHTSLGFGTLPDIPQSRRHSMAEMPTRRNSLTGAADVDNPLSPIERQESQHRFDEPYQASTISDSYERDMQNRNWAQSYFSGVGPALRSRIESAQSPAPAVHGQGMHYQGSPSQGLFGRPGQDTPLYLVSFKCARAEVYYVADNTGLHVKEGDLVIVEADRGHDLGTVLHAKIDWMQARDLKQKCNDEHYRWLMMFSRHNQASEGIASGGTGGMMAGSAPDRSSSHPSGASIFNPSMIDPKNRETELKPKMIKRLAQPHEIATLRDKEGNEAKAKRICSQKVTEMKLDMEILDAEFQTQVPPLTHPPPIFPHADDTCSDWKKLTFFYYANSYVNFNALVTDLFKIYKTRIWMSAVNPASLNTGPLPPPRGLGPGAISGRDSGLGHRAGASRGGYSAMGYGDGYGAAGNGYAGLGGNGAYGYGEDQSHIPQGPSNTPAQQAYDLLNAYNAGQPMAGQSFNPAAMQNYGWGAGYPGQYGGFNPSSMGFGTGMGMNSGRGPAQDQTGGYMPPTRAPMAPISPPGSRHQGQP